MTNLDGILKNRDITLPTKVCILKAMVFLVVIYGYEGWTIKKAECQRVDVFELLEKTLESPLDCKEIKTVHPKGNQSWIFIGRTDAEAEAPILWPPDSKSWLIRKDPEAGKDWGQEEKGVTGDEIVGWMASSTQWMWVWANSRRQWRTGKPGVLHAVPGVTKSWTQLSNWTTAT